MQACFSSLKARSKGATDTTGWSKTALLDQSLGQALMRHFLSLYRAVAETVISLPRISPEGVDASLLRLSSSVIGALLFAWILVSGLNDLGIDIIPLIAGLGVSGLAVALAARPTMENIMGSFMIFWDKPYQVGQRVKVLGHDGTVESIGLRSTRIRLLSGHVTSIPNEKIASLEIENVGRRLYIRRLLDVTITYDTSLVKINLTIEILREILSVPDPACTEMSASADVVNESSAKAADRESHPNEAINQPEFPPRVYFSDLNSDSLNLLVIYWYHRADYWDYLEHATWINVQIMERFSAEDIDFAFPTQTLHLAGDDKRPLAAGQLWESEDTNSSPKAMVAQAAAVGAWTALDQQPHASDSVRPDANAKAEPAGKVEGELTEAPIEDAIMHDGNQGGDVGER